MATVKQVVVTKNTTKRTRVKKKTQEQSTYKCPVCGSTVKK